MKLRKSKNKKIIKAAMNFQPFDYGFLLEMEKEALKKMAEYFDTANIAVTDERSAKEIRLALKLLDIATEEKSAYIPGKTIMEENTIKSIEEGKMLVYVNTRNWKRFFPNFTLDWNKPIFQDSLRVQKAWYLYNKLKYYYQRGWWN